MFPNRKLQRYLALLLVLCCSETKANDAENQTSVSTSFVEPKKDSRGLFSPRMDYDQWTPLGRGDPLKNDPTYDYVPPVLEHVHYWIDPASRKPDPPLPSDVQKTEILVLGVSSKKPSSSAATASHIESRRDTYDPYIKFVDSSSKYNYHGIYSRPQKHQYSGTYYSSPYYSSKIKFESPISQTKDDSQRTPYTVLMPPPLNQPKYEINPELSEIIHNVTSSVDYYKSSTTESSISIDEANLIYHSSTTTTAEDWVNGNTQYATVAEPSSLVTWRTPTPTPAHIEHTSPLINPQIGHTQSSSSSTFKFPIESFDGIQTLSPSDSNPTVTYVAVGDTPMHKGTVTDDKPDLNNSYVNIGKPNLRPSSSLGHETSIPPNKHYTHTHKPVKTIISSRPNYVLSPNQFDYMTSTYRKPPSASSSIRIHHHHLESPVKIQPPMTLQTMQTMQTMQPPPATDIKTMHYQSSTPLLFTLLQKEQEKVTPQYVPTSTTPKPTTPTTTTLSALTTDPLFSHYKQPAAPLRGPMYLIIQGHSKVKTYGPSKTSNNNKETVQEANEISYSDDFKVKHIHSNHLKAIERPVRMELRGHKNLQTLQHVLDTGLGSVDFRKLGKPRQKREQRIQEALLGAQYKVSDGVQTTETYRKGIVESSDIFDMPRKKFQRAKRQLGFEEYLPIEEAEDAISDFFDSVYEGSGL